MRAKLSEIKRLTQSTTRFPCRMNGCTAEEWISEVTGIEVENIDCKIMCNSCPFIKYINRLAEYEDKEILMEDDLK